MFDQSSNLFGQFELPILNLSPRKVTRLLLFMVALLIFFYLLEAASIYWLKTRYGVEIEAQFFSLDQESNFPSLYSALSLGFSSYLLAIIATFKKAVRAKYRRYWKALSLIFLYLGIDEACSIHEIFTPLLRNALNARGIFYFTWVVPAFLGLIIFLWAFRKFIFNLPPKTRTIFIFAGAVYILGALGMELVGGYIADTPGLSVIAYPMATAIEEVLEMLGIIVFINGLLAYIQTHLSQVILTFAFEESRKQLLELK